MEKLYTVNKDKSGADCGSDHELLIAKFINQQEMNSADTLRNLGSEFFPSASKCGHIPAKSLVESF